MKLKNIIKLLIIFFCTNLYAQNKMTIAEIDSLTYSYYQKGEWDRLITLSKQAIEQDIDFYYLRVRTGYAYYMKQNYRKSILHYQKAYHEIPSDIYTLPYLLYAYQFSGRKYDAMALSSKIDSLQLPNLHNTFAPGLKSFGFFYNYNIGNAKSIKDDIRNTIRDKTNGLQKTTNKYNLGSIYLSHNLGRKLLINHTLSFLKKDEHHFVMSDNQLYESPNQKLNQWNYNMQLQINLASGINLVPVYHYLNYKIPIDEVGIDDYTDSSSLYGIIFNSDIHNFNAGISYVMGNLNTTDINQYGLHVSYYPLGNLNLYYRFNGYFQNQKRDELNESNFIHQHILGLKVSDYWWTELSGMFPKVLNFYDPVNGGVWNGLEGTKNAINLKHIFFIKNSKLSLIINAGLSQSISEFTPYETSNNQYISYSYTNINVTGGLLWNF